MSYPTISIQGNILSAELLDELERDERYQSPQRFGLPANQRVKDEIAQAWSESRNLWQVFRSKQRRLPKGATGTTETRRFWMIPFLDTFGYRLTHAGAEKVNEQTYAISHRDEEIDGFPVHIMGFTDDLDRRRETGGPRLSPHALVQEYLNLTEHLYGIVTNGYRLRLLRDASRLTRLSYLEFNLEQMMEEEVYPDFAILYRLLHRTRMPQRQDEVENSIIEHYHQSGLEAGARIRDKLSEAVKTGIERLANALLQEPRNESLRQRLTDGQLTPAAFYNQLLRLIYRLLFLMVIEERDLIFPKNGDVVNPDPTRNPKPETRNRAIYTDCYSLARLRRLAEHARLVDGTKRDLWISLFHTFRLFESPQVGERLGIAPLAGELFGPNALDALHGATLDNATLLDCLGRLTRFRNRQGEWTRVNYAALNVEEFGSVYEGLLEFEAAVTTDAPAGRPRDWRFHFKQGDERAATGAHYTPDELVRPLVEHALDPVMERKLEAAGEDTEARIEALLSLKVCDVACGSGHFLLAAARRIAQEVAKLRTGEEQPNPAALRAATRDAIGRCIYGVDKNPMAVELCKVALWLEAHDPGKPLTFLDHRIKCGDAIVGLARAEDLDRGIPDEAFKTLEGDDKAVAKTLRDRNKKERKQREKSAAGAMTLQLELGDEVDDQLGALAMAYRRFEDLPDATLEERRAKEQAFADLSGPQWWRLKQLADAQVAPFFIPKTLENRDAICTDGPFRRLLHSRNVPYDAFIHRAAAVAQEKRFFHWFLEFPEVMMDEASPERSRGSGFDCVLGNPPFLGGQKLSGTFGLDYPNWLKYSYAPAGSMDLVGYFFRRIFGILNNSGAQGLIATNTIAQGVTRDGGLAVILEEEGAINFAVRSMKWPGVAVLEVALLTIHKSGWNRPCLLDRKPAESINSYLSDEEPLSNPHQLKWNADKSFQGSIVLGKGFVLEPAQAKALIEKDPKNAEVLFSYLNGEDLNGQPDQSSSRSVINFFDWPESKANLYPDCFRIVEQLVKPVRAKNKRKVRREIWWQYAERAPKLYRTITSLTEVLVHTRVTRTHAFAFVPSNQILSDSLTVVALDKMQFFTAMQSSFHEYWAWQHGSTLKNDRRYTPSSCFETFPFPHPTPDQEAALERIGEAYYELRRQLMQRLQLGLTKTYNLFHDPTVDAAALEKAAKAGLDDPEALLADLQRLRELHKEIDEAVRDAYGWRDLDLGHGFHEVDFLPENDRVRWTISPPARKEVLRRLLLLNHERYREEQAAK